MEYDIGVSESLRKIFAGVLIGEVKQDNKDFETIIRTGKINQNRFIGMFPSNIFEDEYAIFYEILVYQHVLYFNSEQLKSVIDNNRDLILDSPYVDLVKLSRLENGNQLTDDDKIEVIKGNMVDILNELSNIYVSEEEFKSSCTIYINWFRNQFMLHTTYNMSRIMSDEGYEEKRPGKRKVRYSGYNDCRKYYNERMKIVNELSDENRVKTTVMNKDWYEKKMQESQTTDDMALMTVGISKIDATVGDLRRSNMIGILGPPKGGKTRFSNFLVQRALSLGLNVCVWPLEGTQSEWEAMQTAAYIARKYGVMLDSKAILQNKLETEQEKSLVRTAKFEMVTDVQYGTLSFIESMAYVEDFLDILDAHYENDNPFDVVVIDSLVNILSHNGASKNDRISSSYMLLKEYISHKIKIPALAIVPAQLKQTAVDFLRDHPGETIDVTAGGESAETIRSPDEVLGLFSSKEERAAGIMKIYSVASRHSEAFEDFQVRTSLKCCHFFDE